MGPDLGVGTEVGGEVGADLEQDLGEGVDLGAVGDLGHAQCRGHWTPTTKLKTHDNQVEFFIFAPNYISDDDC